MREEEPYWLEHFAHYHETGEYINCKPSAKDTCPIHGKQKE